MRQVECARPKNSLAQVWQEGAVKGFLHLAARVLLTGPV